MKFDLVAQLFGMFAAVIGGVWILGKVMHKRAYEDGAHSKEHVIIKEDISSAYDRIRVVEDDVAEFKTITELNIEEHKIILSNQTHTNDRLDKIYEILVARK